VGVPLGFAAARLSDGVAGLGIAVAAILALTFGLWWVRGGRGWRIDAERHVAAPPETVFAILDDPARAPELDPRTTAGERLGDGRERYRTRRGRRELELEFEVAVREPPHRLEQELVAVHRADGRPIAAGTQRQAVELRPEGDGTRVRLSIRGAPASASERIGIGVAHAEEAGHARRMLDRLADLAAQAGAPAR
jgi:uncharacterized protein YndB with AHSA1/START domain